MDTTGMVRAGLNSNNLVAMVTDHLTNCGFEVNRPNSRSGLIHINGSLWINCVSDGGKANAGIERPVSFFTELENSIVFLVTPKARGSSFDRLLRSSEAFSEVRGQRHSVIVNDIEELTEEVLIYV